MCNRQKTRRLNLSLARELVAQLLEEWASAGGKRGAREELRPAGELGIYFVNAAEMAQLNGQFLGHAGSTDVITFDYQEGAEGEECRGEIFVCVDEAVAGAPRFRGTWQKELARYVIHGILHLRGYDDGRRRRGAP